MAVKVLLTPDDLFAMGETDELYELIDGELVPMSPVGQRHGDVELGFLLRLGGHVRSRRLGKVYPGDTGFVFERLNDAVLVPDVAFVRASRLPKTQQLGYLRLPPDLVVEIVSPTDEPGAVRAKVAKYLFAGVRMVLVLEPDDKTVAIHTPGQEPIVLWADDDLDLDEIVPGFRVRVGDLFQEW